MSWGQRAVSVWIVFHIAALTTTALVRAPDELRWANVEAAPRSGISATFTPLVQGISHLVVSTDTLLWKRFRRVETTGRLYTDRLGLGQLWNMFSRPAGSERYVKVAFVLDGHAPRAPGSPVRVMEELVFPASPVDRVRPIASSDFYRSKAVDEAIVEFRLSGALRTLAAANERRGKGPAAEAEATALEAKLPRDLTPIATYFRGRFLRQPLPDGQRIVSTEVWSGSVRTPPPGQITDDDDVQARAAVIASYLDGPRLTYRSRELRPGISTREGDIVWTLYYAEPSPDGRAPTNPSF